MKTKLNVYPLKVGHKVLGRYYRTFEEKTEQRLCPVKDMRASALEIESKIIEKNNALILS